MPVRIMVWQIKENGYTTQQSKQSLAMCANHSKVYWERQTKEMSAGHLATVTFSDGSTMPTNMPVASDLQVLFRSQKLLAILKRRLAMKIKTKKAILGGLWLVFLSLALAFIFCQ